MDASKNTKDNSEFERSMFDLAKSIMSNDDEQEARSLYEATLAICKAQGHDTSVYPCWDSLDSQRKAFWLNMHQNNVKMSEDNP